MTSPTEEARRAARKAFNAGMGRLGVDPVTTAIDAYEAKMAELGYVRVPREATPDMLYEMGQAANFHLPRDANRALVWRAMVDAANPTPPTPEQPQPQQQQHKPPA